MSRSRIDAGASRPAPAGMPVPSALRAQIAQHWSAARRVHPDLGYPCDAYVDDVMRLWTRRRVRMGLDPDMQTDASAFVAALDRMAHDDLYLARCCDARVAHAWTTLIDTYRAGLERICHKHVRHANAEQVVGAVLSDAALPPSDGRERTLLGTYEGTGSLWGWLTTVVVRRARRDRPARTLSLDQPAGHASERPTSEVELDGSAQEFATLLRAAWEGLEDRESLALALKFHDGHTQRRIAVLLGTSTPTVTRLIQRAIAKLRGHLLSHVDAMGSASRSSWTRFDAVLTRHLSAVAASQGEGPNAEPEDAP